MLKLIKLELKRTSFKPYLIAVASIILATAGILHIIWFGTKAEGDTLIAGDFLALASIFLTMCFAVLAAVMLGRLVISEYGGKNAVLLFSYPIKRSRVFLAKLSLIGLFILVSTVFAGFGLVVILLLTNAAFGLLTFAFNGAFITTFLLTAPAAGIIALGVAMAGLWNGLRMNSLPATIVTTLILLSPFGNLLVPAIRTNVGLLGILSAAALLLAVIAYLVIVKGLDKREV